jgi:hypothetical protein
MLLQWESVVRTLADCLRGRLVWTIQIFFQITQPGSSNVGVSVTTEAEHSPAENLWRLCASSLSANVCKQGKIELDPVGWLVVMQIIEGSILIFSTGTE